MPKKQKSKNATVQNSSKSKSILRVILAATLILIIPLLGNNFVDGWNWTVGEFIFAWIVIVCFGLVYVFVSRKMNNSSYRFAVGIAVVTGFLLFWVNAAVGMIGEDNPANLMYGGVLLIGLVGALIARFQPKVMSLTLFLMALAQMLVPTIAIIIWPPEVVSWSPGVFRVFVLNAFFALLWIGSALLFRRAAHKTNKIK